MGQDCTETYLIREEGADARSIANYVGIPKETFEANNYCYKEGDSTICPPFPLETVSFWILDEGLSEFLSLLLTDCVRCKTRHWESPEVWEDPESSGVRIYEPSNSPSHTARKLCNTRLRPIAQYQY